MNLTEMKADERPPHITRAHELTGIDPLRAMEVYLSRIGTVREVARQHGYAIGLHGSMKRDLDLVAVPWVENASPAEALVYAIAVAVSGFVLDRADPAKTPTRKPHGRLAWTIHLGGGPYIDLSVMPRESTKDPA